MNMMMTMCMQDVMTRMDGMMTMMEGMKSEDMMACMDMDMMMKCMQQCDEMMTKMMRMMTEAKQAAM